MTKITKMFMKNNVIFVVGNETNSFVWHSQELPLVQELEQAPALV